MYDSSLSQKQRQQQFKHPRFAKKPKNENKKMKRGGGGGGGGCNDDDDDMYVLEMIIVKVGKEALWACMHRGRQEALMAAVIFSKMATAPGVYVQVIRFVFRRYEAVSDEEVDEDNAIIRLEPAFCKRGFYFVDRV